MEGPAKVSPLLSVFAGAVAGGAESLITYPTEYVKTRKQLLKAGGTESTINILTTAIRTNGLSALYTGAGAFCASNALKSGVRFLTFDTVRDRLAKDIKTGRPTATSTMLAGVAAGIAESITVVTPGENIKTKMIQGRQAAQYAPSAGQVVQSIIRTDGVLGLYRGVSPVAIKQGSNALIRFTSYTAILDTIKPYFQQAGLSAWTPAAAGAAAGVATVYGTMPADVVKTKLQSQDAGSARQSLRACIYEIINTSGISGLWKGTTPRLARLSISGAVSFSIYTKVVEVMRNASTPLVKQAV